MKCLCLPDARNGDGHRGRSRAPLPQPAATALGLPRPRADPARASASSAAEVRWTDVVIQHVGYQDPALRQRKLERDLRLLMMEYQEQPNDPFTLFNLGIARREREETAVALDLFRRSLALSTPTDSIVRKLYAEIINCHRRLKQFPERCKPARSQPALSRGPGDSHPGRLHPSRRRRSPGRHRQTRTDPCLPRRPPLRQSRPGHARLQDPPQPRRLPPGSGRLDDARAQWRLALDEKPDFVPALFSVADIAFQLKDWADFDDIVRRIEALGKHATDVLTLKVRRGLAHQDFAAARAAIAQAIAAAPTAVWPRVVLTHILLQEGKTGPPPKPPSRVLVLDPTTPKPNASSPSSSSRISSQ